jgi:hypothetical protein
MNPVFELIASLARQIGGEIEQQSADTGTATTLKFPLMKYIGWMAIMESEARAADAARDRDRAMTF